MRRRLLAALLLLPLGAVGAAAQTDSTFGSSASQSGGQLPLKLRDASVRGDARCQDGIVASEHRWHGLRVLLPQPGAPFDVGKQKGDRAGRQHFGWRLDYGRRFDWLCGDIKLVSG